MRQLHKGTFLDTVVLSLHFVSWVSQVTLGLILLRVKFGFLFHTIFAFARGFKSGVKNSIWHG
jgi:hypothetical protein